MTPSSSVSLVILETRYHELARLALQHWTRRINFHEVIVFSDQNIMPGSKWVPVNPLLDENKDYGDILVRGMWPFVKSDYMILINWDTLLRDQSAWTTEFFDYDYIGSMWPWQAPHSDNTDHCGVSWRSKRLLEAMRYPAVESITDAVPYHVSHHMEKIMRDKFNIRISDQDMDRRFVLEFEQDDGKSFAVRGLWNIINVFSRDISESYVLGMPAMMWDDLSAAHEIVAALINREYFDLLRFHSSTIKASANYINLMAWLEKETFPHQQTVIQILT